MPIRRLVVAVALVGCGDGAAHEPDAAAPVDAAVPNPPGTIGRYEAEDATLLGGAAIVGAADRSARTAGDLAGEASGRRAVTLASPGDGLAITVLPADAGANAMIVRYSLPDLAGGGGQSTPLTVVARDASGAMLAMATLVLTSRYAWAYGSVAAGTKLYNVPAAAQTNDGAASPIHVYDEIQLLLAAPLPAGATLALAPPGTGPPITIDFVELEIVPPPLPAAPDLLSITDARCGAIALDTHGTGRVFDGIDDSSYASSFVAATGINPFNPTSANGTQPAGTQEKDYYTSAPGDELQDASPTAASANLSMFDLADHNLAALQACIAAVTAPGSTYTGIFIPPGRYYARGSLTLPSNVAIRGAGMWYAKLVAVDTDAPVAVTNPSNNLTGIASTSGDLRIVASASGSSNVAISDLAMFGNVTQRDHVDRVAPIGVIGQFSSSEIARVWVEHYVQGVVVNGASTANMLSELRVRDTFADGIDLFGQTSTTTVTRAHTRGTGDDGVAVWSQSATSASTGNAVTSTTSELPWFGNGFGIYGGANVTLDGLTAIDTLSGAGVKLSTEFVPATLPATFAMTGVMASGVTLSRCGGNGFAAGTGALLVGPMVESIAGMTIDHVEIDDPTFAAIDIRVLSNIGKVTMPGSLDLTIANASVRGESATGCTDVGASIAGMAALTNACSCGATGTATACDVTSASTATFAVSSSCAQCPPAVR